MWSLCDSRTGFLLRIYIYTSKDISRITEGGLGYRVVSSLLTDFENRVHLVYLGNFYSDVEFYDSLRLKQIGTCGTVTC